MVRVIRNSRQIEFLFHDLTVYGIRYLQARRAENVGNVELQQRCRLALSVIEQRTLQAGGATIDCQDSQINSYYT
jgi:hypothetical protein